MKKLIAMGASFGLAISLLSGCAVVGKPNTAPPMWGKDKKEYEAKKAEEVAKKAQEQKEQNK